MATDPKAPAATTPATPAPAATTPATSAATAADGAKAVADAVTQVANAAVAAVQKTASAPKPLDVSGSPGGAFSIHGSGFGSSGTLTIAGRQVKTTAWGDNRIKGTLPADIASGEVVIDSGGKKQTGTFTNGVKK
jgi:hypothetical protein